MGVPFAKSGVLLVCFLAAVTFKLFKHYYKVTFSNPYLFLELDGLLLSQFSNLLSRDFTAGFEFSGFVPVLR